MFSTPHRIWEGLDNAERIAYHLKPKRCGGCGKSLLKIFRSLKTTEKIGDVWVRVYIFNCSLCYNIVFIGTTDEFREYLLVLEE